MELGRGDRWLLTVTGMLDAHIGPGETTWVWVLEPVTDGATRLISRVRATYRWHDPASMAFAPLLEFADMWMMRRMLLNLRARIEATMQHQPSATEAEAG